MKKILSVLGVLLLSFSWLQPVQAKITDEHYFRFTFNNQAEVKAITNTISIDKVKGNEAWAYANTKEFEAFKQRGFQFEELMHPTDEAFASNRLTTMATTVAQMANWDCYPTYDVYVQMINKLATDYPDICKVENFGTTANNRQLLALKISDNVQTDEEEAEVFLSNTMHGNETTGMTLLLRLADSLATKYNSNARITNLVNNLEIFIAPNTNPDGTYKGGNNTLEGATRTNGNGVDLNRNYPDFISGDHPDGEVWQPETIANMNFAKAHHFVMGWNGHGGTEVINYPWDTKPQLNADDTWWQAISQAYVDTCRKVNPSYMTILYPSGITNGYAWYEADGSHQDWMNYYGHCREVTMEFSIDKLLGTENLRKYWNYNRHALLVWMEWCLNKGIKGRITDGSGNPIHKVQVKLLNHDQDSTEVYTEQHGVYYRLINPGTYNMQFTYNGMSKTVNNVVVPASGLVTVDVIMQSIADVPAFGALTGNTALPGNALNLNLTVTTDTQVPEYVKATYTINGQTTTINMAAAKADRHYIGTIPAQSSATEGSVYFKSKYPSKTEVQSSNYTLKWSVDPIIYFTEDFEGSFPPANWTNNGWTQGTEAHGGSKCAKAAYQSPAEKIITTKTINLSQTERDTVSFWWKDDDISKVAAHDTTYFQISANGGQNWTTVSFLSTAAHETQYNKFTYVIPANMLTNNFKMRWKDRTDGTASAWGVGVDDIKIIGFPITAIIDDENVVISHNTVTNYPNPFNPETVINFNLQKDARINLSVFNIKGELVSTLINGNQTAGIHAIKFDGSKLNSGVYFYRLSAGKENVTGKMMLVK